MNLREFVRSWLFADAPGQPAGLESYQGASGVRFSGGVIDAGEFNTDLKGTKGAKVYDQMRREAMVKAPIQLINLPILGAKWDIEAEDDAVRDFLVEALFERIDWEQYLRHCLLTYTFGFEVLEKIWVKEGGKLWYEALEHRSQRSIAKWHADPETGALAGIEQQAWKGSEWGTFKIPDEQSPMDARFKLVHLALDQEGNNFEGISGLRGAYPYWKGKTELFKFGLMDAERFSVGIPEAEPPLDESSGAPRGRFSAEDKNEAISMLQRIRAGAQAYIWNPGGWKFKVFGKEKEKQFDPIPLLQYCDEMIALNSLAEFLNLGRTATGARAVADPQTALFMLALESMAELIRIRTEQWVIRPLIELNYPNPQNIKAGLRWSDLETKHPEKVAEYITKMTAAGLLTPDEDLEDHVREVGDLPPREGEVSKAAGERPHRNRISLAVSSYWRDLTPAEKTVSLREIDGKQDDAEERIGDQVDQLKKVWIDDLVGQIDTALADGDVRDVADISIDKKLRYTEVSETISQLRDLFRFGRRTVREEKARQAKQATDGAGRALRDDDITDKEITDGLWVRVRRYFDNLAARLTSVAVERGLNLSRTKGTDYDEADLEEISASLDDMFGPTARIEARVLIAEAFTLGRNREAEIQADDIARVEYSAILDTNVCSVCESDDGRTFVMGSADYYAHMPPNASCLSTASGSNRCRCLYVYIFTTEQEAVR